MEKNNQGILCSSAAVSHPAALLFIVDSTHLLSSTRTRNERDTVKENRRNDVEAKDAHEESDPRQTREECRGETDRTAEQQNGNKQQTWLHRLRRLPGTQGKQRTESSMLTESNRE